MTTQIQPQNYIAVNMVDQGQEQETPKPSLPMNAITNTACSIRSMCGSAANWVWENKGKIGLGVLCMAGSYIGSRLGTNQSNAELAKTVNDFKHDIGQKMDLLGNNFSPSFSNMGQKGEQGIFTTTTQVPDHFIDVTKNTTVKTASEATTDGTANNMEKCKKQYYIFEYDGIDFSNFAYDGYAMLENFGVGYSPASEKIQPVVRYNVTVGQEFECYVEVENGIPSDKKPYAIFAEHGSMSHNAFETEIGENNLITVKAENNDVKITEIKFDAQTDCALIKEQIGAIPCLDDKIIWGGTANEPRSLKRL